MSEDGKCCSEVASKERAVGAYIRVAARQKSVRDEYALHSIDTSNMMERDDYSK